ncbi:MAG: DUF3842 family protein [Christensenellales bacterium]|jgi:NAD(P)-dependent dehydrogenase (short-subunit alcohol dehydrogenase family)
MKIAIIDGQGGGIGKMLVERLKQRLPHVTLIALGTNAMATAAMLKAGTHESATGENAIVYNVKRCQLIMGVIGIVSPNAMMGELTPVMAAAIAESDADKILIPYNKCGIVIAGVQGQTMSTLIDSAVELAQRAVSRME